MNLATNIGEIPPHIQPSSVEVFGNANTVQLLQELTRDKKLLIVGSVPNPKLTSELMKDLKFTEIEWPRCDRGDSPDKINGIMSRFDFLMLQVRFLTHIKVSDFKRLAKLHGLTVIMNDSDSITRTVENFHEQCQGRTTFVCLSEENLMIPVGKGKQASTRTKRGTPEWHAKLRENGKKAWEGEENRRRGEEALARGRQTRADRARKQTEPAAPVVETKPEPVPIETVPVVTHTPPPVVYAPDAPVIPMDALRQVRERLSTRKQTIDAEIATCEAQKALLAQQLADSIAAADLLAIEKTSMDDRIYALDQVFLAFEEKA